MLLNLPRFCALIFFTSNSAVFVGGSAKIALLPGVGTLAPPLITLWVPLLCHNGFAPASAWNCLTKETQHIIFYAHVHARRPSYTDEEWKTLWHGHKRSNFWGDARFWFCPNLIKSAQILPKFAKISPKSNQICPNLISFASKNLLGDATAYVV